MKATVVFGVISKPPVKKQGLETRQTIRRKGEREAGVRGKENNSTAAFSKNTVH